MNINLIDTAHTPPNSTHSQSLRLTMEAASIHIDISLSKMKDTMKAHIIQNTLHGMFIYHH